MGQGKVYLIGAGPGDPKLITVRGLEAIKKADTVVYDRLANPLLLRQMKPGAESIYVGKLPDRHTLRQEVINQLLVDLALSGKIVARLKGGDPSIFGRVGEEAELLAENNVAFEIIPGITSAISVPAYAGIPVTHRDFTSSLAIVTGHECPVKSNSNIDWGKLSTATGTLIFLMGVANIETIRDTLILNGKSEDTPVAFIRSGTTAGQQTLVGTLKTIVEQVMEAKMLSPAIIIVGEVVKLREKLAWFESKPLFGQRILITRSVNQTSELAELIDEYGGEPIELPVLRIQDVTDPDKILLQKAAISKLETYDWVLFTSVNGVEYFFRQLQEAGRDIRSLYKARVAAVGPKTAKALRDKGFLVDQLPSIYQAEGLLKLIEPDLHPGQKALLPRADIARRELPDRLMEKGLEVTEMDVYESVLARENGAELLELLQTGQVNILTFTSSSTVTNLLRLLAEIQDEDPLKLLHGIKTACIGAVTAQTLREAGLPVTYLAAEATIPALVQAIVEGAATS